MTSGRDYWLNGDHDVRENMAKDLATKETQTMKVLNVHVLCTGSAESIAKNLRKLADQIDKGEKPSIRNCGIRVFTREPVEDNSEFGEHVIEGRYYAVCSDDDPIAQPFALFRKQEMAEGFAGVVTKFNLYASTVARVDLFGSLFDGIYADDPHEKAM
jgi:hypothetical protein